MDLGKELILVHVIRHDQSYNAVRAPLLDFLVVIQVIHASRVRDPVSDSGGESCQPGPEPRADHA